MLMGLLMAAAVSVLAAPAVLRSGGSCTVRAESPASFSLTNQDLTATVAIRLDPDFFGAYVVIANPQFSNTAGKKLDVSYSLAFFDKAGALIGCVSQGSSLDAKANGMTFASCLLQAPPEQVAKIASYQAVIYESEAKPKK